MDTPTIFTALIIVLLFITPFVLINRHNRKKEQPLLEALWAIAKKNNCDVSQHDVWNNTAIGIDKANSMVFFTQKLNSIKTAQQLALAEIKKCRIVSTNKITGNKDDGNFKEVDKLELAFAYKEKNNAETVLEFYNSGINSSSLTGELELAERWCKIANDTIKAMA